MRDPAGGYRAERLKRHDDAVRRIERATNLVIGVAVLVSLAVTGLVAFVAYHFIAKWW